MKKIDLKTWLLMAVLAAASLVLRQFDFPIFPPAPFLRFDFSDLLALIGMLVAGPWGLVTVALIRDFLNYLLQGGQAGLPIGALMSFTASLAMFIPTHLILQRASRKGRLWKGTHIQAGISLTLSLSLVMTWFNYFIALPWYAAVLDFPIDNYLSYSLVLILPFNLIKGGILSVCQSFILKKFLPILDRLDSLYPAYQGLTNHSLSQSGQQFD